MSLEQQLQGIMGSFEKALAEEDWQTLGALDSKLQHAIPKIKQQPLSVADKQQLQRLNQLYSTMIAAGEREKVHTQQQIQQQECNKEGVLAYLQNS
ncbi:MAG: hypothetical protein V7735_07130 [Photobacterium frigidiphilum]|uniref:hypothetical protein n=1 Tax=Photobacterium frigidiphilum TaxID=264736 RepID=UPI003001BD8E